MKCLIYYALGVTALLTSIHGLRAAETASADSEIKTLLRERVRPAGQIPGIVVGILDETGSRIVSAGKLSRTKEGAVDGDTVFEIGSATKVFTALLLADMVGRGEVSLVVASLGVRNGLLSADAFSAVVGLVLISTLLTPPLLRLVYPAVDSSPPQRDNLV